MKEEDKKQARRSIQRIALGSRTCKKFAGKQWHRINLERRDGSKHCPARDSSRCSSTRQ